MNFNEYKALMTAVGATVRSRIVSIEEFPDCGAGPKVFHVTGECSPAEWHETMAATERACRIMEKLDAMRIYVDYDDLRKLDKEAYRALVEKYKEELRAVAGPQQEGANETN